MNAYEWWNGSNGTIAFAVTDMDWDTFSEESHAFQCGPDFDTDTSGYTPKDFERLMREKGHTITVYMLDESADWWCNDGLIAKEERE
jgi:hypothetical protein